MTILEAVSPLCLKVLHACDKGSGLEPGLPIASHKCKDEEDPVGWTEVVDSCKPYRYVASSIQDNSHKDCYEWTKSIHVCQYQHHAIEFLIEW